MFLYDKSHVFFSLYPFTFTLTFRIRSGSAGVQPVSYLDVHGEAVPEPLHSGQFRGVHLASLCFIAKKLYHQIINTYYVNLENLPAKYTH